MPLSLVVGFSQMSPTGRRKKDRSQVKQSQGLGDTEYFGGLMKCWRDGLQEMLVESGLATWAEGDSNDLRKTDITSGKNLTWYSFRHTWITFALERGVPIATVCNNCDTSIQYIQEHYFHYDAKRATDALATGRGPLKGATGTDWMRDPYVHDS